MLHDGMIGENNCNWKGDRASYSAIHHFLIRNFPKSGTCDECEKVGKTHYALLRGRSYSRNREDYRELCPRCHKWYDEDGGEDNAQAKLTLEQVQEIRKRYRRRPGGGRKGDHPPGPREGSSVALAAEFGVDRTIIMKIVKGRKWGQSFNEDAGPLPS